MWPIRTRCDSGRGGGLDVAVTRRRGLALPLLAHAAGRARLARRVAPEPAHVALRDLVGHRRPLEARATGGAVAELTAALDVVARRSDPVRAELALPSWVRRHPVVRVALGLRQRPGPQAVSSVGLGGAPFRKETNKKTVNTFVFSAF